MKPMSVFKFLKEIRTGRPNFTTVLTTHVTMYVNSVFVHYASM